MKTGEIYVQYNQRVLERKLPNHPQANINKTYTRDI